MRNWEETEAAKFDRDIRDDLLQKDRSKRAIRRQNKKRFDKREDEY